MSWPHLLRILAVSTGGVIIAQVLIVFYVYLLAWKRSPNRRGLIPAHVLAVSVFTIITQVLFMILVMDLVHRDAPLAFYGPMILVANVDLMVALWFIFRFDRRRISAASCSAGYDGDLPRRRAEDFAPLDHRWWGRGRA